MATGSIAGMRKGAPGPDVEAGAMAWALDLATDQLAFGKRTAVVSAHVVDGVEGAIDVEDGDGPAVNLDQFLAAHG